MQAPRFQSCLNQFTAGEHVHAMTSDPVPLKLTVVLVEDTLTAFAEVVSVAVQTGGEEYAVTNEREALPPKSVIVPALMPSDP